MTRLRFLKIPVRVYTSFIITVIIMIALGYIEQFFIILTVVTLHELSHVFVAKRFGLKTDKINFTPLGENAEIKDMVFLSGGQKIIVLLAGPMVNLIIGSLTFMLFPDDFIFFRNTNIAIGLFNLAPIYPLDGGKILLSALSNKIGVIKSNRIVYSIACVTLKGIYVLGFIQVILFPYNVSLLCMGAYLSVVNRREYFNISFEFFRVAILQQKKVENKEILPVKTFMIKKDTELKKVINILTYDYFFIFNVYNNREIMGVLNEAEIGRYIRNNGLNGSISDVLNQKLDT